MLLVLMLMFSAIIYYIEVISCDLMSDYHEVESAMFVIIEVRCHQHNYKIFLCFRGINYRDSNCNHPF